MNRKTWLICSALCLFLAACTAQAQTTKQSDDNSTIHSLLNEVRLLRKTLQRTGLNAYRSQIIVEGLRTRNEQVARLTRMLEENGREIEGIESSIPRLIERNSLMEEMIARESDANKRAMLEFENKDRKRDVDRYKMLLERTKEREQQLNAQLRDEQSKLKDLESRLDSLEREIESEVDRLRTEESQEGKKRP
ncbi:MAG TPA: hypothetical protein VFV34_04770 [Blastocatellia bacterium]|nr:hypothetical protein [Blastocatellia bacterium]